MAQTIVIGRITADLEMKTSANGNPYVRFDLVENIGSKENSRPQYFQICAWSDDAKRIVKARAKRGSLIWVSGSLELETFTKRDGITTDKRLKILLDNWGFILISRIISYFNAKYHVSIDPDPVRSVLLPQAPQYSWSKEQTRQYHETMEQLLLSYEDILEQIFIQLGGRTFIEKAVDELKEKCHAAAWNTYHNTAQYEVKNDTIRFTSYACKFDDWLGRPKWSLNDGMKNILRGAAHFETGSLEYYPSCISTLLGWDDIAIGRLPIIFRLHHLVVLTEITAPNFQIRNILVRRIYQLTDYLV